MVPSERSTASDGSVALVGAGGETLVVNALAARALWPATSMNPTARERERVGLLMSSSVTLGRPRSGRRFHPGPLRIMCNTGSHEMSPSQTPNLTGRVLPSLRLPSTAGGSIDPSALGNPLAGQYLYPMTARPGVPLPEGWDLIPGARGCTPEGCSFRARYPELGALALDVYALSRHGS